MRGAGLRLEPGFRVIGWGWYAGVCSGLGGCVVDNVGIPDCQHQASTRIDLLDGEPWPVLGRGQHVPHGEILQVPVMRRALGRPPLSMRSKLYQPARE